MTGDDLKRYRILSHLTQQQLGEKLGLTGRSAGNTVQKWEYESQPIPLKYIRQLSKILEVPIDKFIP